MRLKEFTMNNYNRDKVYVDVPEDKQNWLLVNLLTGEYEIVEEEE